MTHSGGRRHGVDKAQRIATVLGRRGKIPARRTEAAELAGGRPINARSRVD
jgi:hypothetical protein